MQIFPVIGYVTIALIMLTYPFFRRTYREGISGSVSAEIGGFLFFTLFFGACYYGGLAAIAFALAL